MSYVPYTEIQITEENSSISIVIPKGKRFTIDRINFTANKTILTFL